MPAAPLDTILASADDLLEARAFADYCPIGLQVRGTRESISTIATSVSSTLDAFERAEQLGADLLLTHHGLFWKGTPQVVDGAMRARLQRLLASGMTLAAYHLPLDAHPTIGNNALIAQGLNARVTGEPFATHAGRSIGLVAELTSSTPLDAFVRSVRDLVGGREPLVLGATDLQARRVAICSGASAGNIEEAAALGCEVLLTGEPREDSAALGSELGVALVAAGHYATETFGIRALGDHLAQVHGIRHVFLPADNPV